ncbi:TniB family NTP-binding protein [Frateuria sp. YIM B11624]|uniref:TniB family NTP-binding protein n=1 Tax=Frateuria sp. YIM B11624 TaxID=3143185 RepID=UPI003C715CCB
MDHVDESVRPILLLSAKERLAYMRRPKWFSYAAADAMLERLEGLLDYPPSHRMPGLQILGDSNSGKTAVGLEFLARHPMDANPEGDAAIIPVLRIEVPPNPDESRLYDEIFLALRQPFRARDPVSEKARQVRALLDGVGCRVLLLDEFQHVLGPRNDRRRVVMDVVKHLGNILRLSVVVLGTTEAQVAVSKDEQLANRLTPIWMPTWRMDSEYRRLLASFEATLPLREPSRLQQRDTAALILGLSEGLLGEMRDLLCMAVAEALHRGEESITQALLRSVGWTPPSDRRRRIATARS